MSQEVNSPVEDDKSTEETLKAEKNTVTPASEDLGQTLVKKKSKYLNI